MSWHIKCVLYQIPNSWHALFQQWFENVGSLSFQMLTHHPNFLHTIICQRIVLSMTHHSLAYYLIWPTFSKFVYLFSSLLSASQLENKLHETRAKPLLFLTLSTPGKPWHMGSCSSVNIRG